MLKFLKNEKRMLIITSIVILLPIVAGLILWNKLPSEVATHFNAKGVADGYSSKVFAVFGIPFIIFGTHILCTLAMMLDPKVENNSSKVRYMVLWIMPITSVLLQVGVLGMAVGVKMNMGLLVQILVALLFIMIGNYLPKCQHNFTIGIKTPWTLVDVDVWNKTHKFGGILWIVCGIIMLLNTLTVNKGIIMGIAIVVICIVPSVYSLLIYKKKNKKG